MTREQAKPLQDFLEGKLKSIFVPGKNKDKGILYVFFFQKKGANVEGVFSDCELAKVILEGIASTIESYAEHVAKECGTLKRDTEEKCWKAMRGEE